MSFTIRNDKATWPKSTILKKSNDKNIFFCFKKKKNSIVNDFKKTQNLSIND